MIEYLKAHPWSWLAVATLALAVLTWGVMLFLQWWHWHQIGTAAPTFSPFRAGHLPGGRGDAFGVLIPEGKPRPKGGQHVWIVMDEKKKEKELFLLRGVESLSVIDGYNQKVSPEVYLVIDASLLDEEILRINEQCHVKLPNNILPPTPKQDLRVPAPSGAVGG
jgi:hypothetical protein